MKSTLTQREQKLLAAGAVLLLLVGWTYVNYIVGPLMRESSALGQDLSRTRDELKLLQLATANEAALRQQHEQLDKSVAVLQELLPSEKEIPAVIELLSDLASQADVKIQSIFPQRPAADKNKETAATLTTIPAAPVVYKDVVIQIEATSGFHQLGSFLSLIESQTTPMQVVSLKITTDPKFLRMQRVKLLIRSYFALVGAPGVDASRQSG